jgi:site-specific recombinase XerD
MAIRALGSKFQVDFMQDGRRYRPVFDTKMEAEAWELETKAKLIRGQHVAEAAKAQSGAAPETIEGLVTYVTTHHWAKKKSAKILIRHGQLYAVWVGKHMKISAALTTERINAYCRDLEARARSGSTVNRHLSAISTLVKFAISLRRMKADDKPQLVWQREGTGRLRFFDEEELKVLFAHLRHMGRDEDAEFYEFLVDTGARLGEALKLEWVNVAKDLSRATFVDTKSGRDRTVPLTPRTRRNLEALRRGARGADAGPFVNFSKGTMIARWRRLQTRLPFLQDCVPHHTFRHTTASWLVQRGIDLYRVKAFMGHSSITTTERYAHLAPKHMDALAAVLGQVDMVPSPGLEPGRLNGTAS